MLQPLPGKPGAGVAPRVIAFRILLATLVLSTVGGMTSALRDRAGFVASFPGASNDAVFGLFIGTATLGLIAVAGLWAWRRWAAFMFVAVTAASLSLDVVASAPVVHQVAVASIGAMIVFAAYLNRARFRR